MLAMYHVVDQFLLSLRKTTTAALVTRETMITNVHRDNIDIPEELGSLVSPALSQSTDKKPP